MENSRLSQFGLQPKQWRSETEPDLPQGYVHIRSALRALLMAEHDAAYIEPRATSRNLVARALKEFRTMEAGTAPSADEVRHELIMLPDLGVFDNLAYKVEGNDVTLVGQVTRPTLKLDAENVVKRIEGVEHVNNLIEVLPLSPFDDNLRVRLFRSIYGYGRLRRYALGVNKPIRIIVKQGHVDLEGVVDNEMDRNIAGIRANTVPDIFSVTNHLQVAR